VTASKFAPTTTVTASADPSILNQPVTFTATVAAPAGATDAPTGTVQFQVDSVNFGGPVPLNNAGQASFTTPSLAAGPHTITALYSGDTCFYANPGSLTQSVLYNFSGFQAPLNQSLTFALNRAIPIRFSLSDFNNTAVTNLGAVTSLLIAAGTNTSHGTPFNPASTGNTGLHLDGTAFALNWQTKGLAAGNYVVLLSLADGTLQTKDLALSANGASAGLLADGSTGTGTTGTGGLQGGDVALYVDNSAGSFTADELARIDDAVTAVDAVLAPYGVAVSEINDGTLANVVIDTNTTSAVGGYADSVLGCESAGAASTEITLIEGWNWYAGSDPAAVGSGQYDFETVVMHELGHALGLGHSAEPTSVMYATLSSGTAKRVMTTADLNVPDADGGGASGLHAAGSPFGPSSPVLFQTGAAGAVASGPSASPVGALPPATGVLTTTPISTVLMPQPAAFQQPAWSTAQAAVVSEGSVASFVVRRGAQKHEDSLLPSIASVVPDASAPLEVHGRADATVSQPSDHSSHGQQPLRELQESGSENEEIPNSARPPSAPAIDSALEELGSDESVKHEGGRMNRTGSGPAQFRFIPHPSSFILPEEEPASAPSALAAVLLAAGFCGYGSRLATATNRKARTAELNRRVRPLGVPF
jgi:hypothetical protein